jgi:hypothetical protein
MAKSMTDFEKVLNAQPRRAEFEITMNADSTVEVWADIDTGISDGQGWVVYGMEYVFENIAPTVPITGIWPIAGSGNQAVLQIHRNDDNELLLNSNDNELLMQDILGYTLSTSGALEYRQPFKVAKTTVTLAPTLRAIFRTAVDDTALSAATIQLAGAILYDVIKAPARISSKLGTLADL